LRGSNAPAESTRHVQACIVEGLLEVFHRQQRATAFHVQQVVEQVVVLGLLRQSFQQIALRGRAAQLQVVQRVFVAFELEDFEAVRDASSSDQTAVYLFFHSE
jgi:hypothetical protein